MVGRVPRHPTIELANSNLGRLRHDCVRQLGLGYRIGPMGGPGCLPPLTAGHRLGREGLTSPPIADGRWFPREHRPFALHPRGGRVPPALFVDVFAAQAQSCSEARRRGASLRFRARRVPAERLRRRRRLGGARGAAGCVDGPSPRPPRSLPAADTGRFPGLPLLHDLRGRRGHARTRAGCCEGFRVETAEGRRSERWSSCNTDRPSSSRTGSSCAGAGSRRESWSCPWQASPRSCRARNASSSAPKPPNSLRAPNSEGSARASGRVGAHAYRSDRPLGVPATRELDHRVREAALLPSCERQTSETIPVLSAVRTPARPLPRLAQKSSDTNIGALQAPLATPAAVGRADPR
jgi:hypothetical protein